MTTDFVDSLRASWPVHLEYLEQATAQDHETSGKTKN